eukprot:TRINITY_DN8354_c0_g1_i7.p1 TRINITY_DN8354_c0_g1~~TRINITY_DN8354_c0_g1_i7.p1  ORF type:complete len:123 (+),score=22.16 TRINITY_DN8354_c0_g1_i7:856-1224(+)
MMPSLHQLYPDGFRYLQDNDPSHTDKQSMRHLKSIAPNILRMPAQSPDINVIEHEWAQLDRRVAAHRPRTVADLERSVKQEWDKISIEECNRLIDGLRPTMLAIIAAGGEHVSPADRRRYRA